MRKFSLDTTRFPDLLQFLWEMKRKTEKKFNGATCSKKRIITCENKRQGGVRQIILLQQRDVHKWWEWEAKNKSLAINFMHLHHPCPFTPIFSIIKICKWGKCNHAKKMWYFQATIKITLRKHQSMFLRVKMQFFVLIIAYHGLSRLINYCSKNRKNESYMFGTFRIDRCLRKMTISVPFPITPMIKMMAKSTGMM